MKKTRRAACPRARGAPEDRPAPRRRPVLGRRGGGGPRAPGPPLARRARVLCDVAVAPRFVRAAARLLLCEIARELARVYGVDEGAFGVLCAFVEVQSAATIGGRAVGPTSQ